MNKSSFEQNGGTYRMVGDYKIPNITLPAEASKPLGVWGLKRKDYLMKHKRVQFNIMLMNGTLWNHLAEVDEQALDICTCYGCFVISVCCIVDAADFCNCFVNLCNELVAGFVSSFKNCSFVSGDILCIKESLNI